MALLRTLVDALSRALFWLTAIIIVLMAVAVTYEVVCRYVFGQPTIWVSESSSYMLVAVAFLGAAWTLRVDGHIRMELLAEIGGQRGRMVSDLAMFLVGAAISVALAWTGWNMTLANYNFGWRSSTLMATPLWIPQMLIPIGAVALLLQCLVGFLDVLSGRRYQEGNGQ
ncbi:TRAP transporter small permease subunit [Xanthobacter sp. TB0139]|uniref:TRAP transporter small permease subunit n=1 Tax=Xanthobacter sp. TB0139 TaxID=3459178 RepID=UPI00403A17EE